MVLGKQIPVLYILRSDQEKNDHNLEIFCKQ